MSTNHTSTIIHDIDGIKITEEAIRMFSYWQMDDGRPLEADIELMQKAVCNIALQLDSLLNDEHRPHLIEAIITMSRIANSLERLVYKT